MFYREWEIEAKDAQQANDKLQRFIDQSEFGGDVQCDGSYEFEDEPVTCPKCKGSGIEGKDGADCEKCLGQGEIPFEP